MSAEPGRARRLAKAGVAAARAATLASGALALVFGARAGGGFSPELSRLIALLLCAGLAFATLRGLRESLVPLAGLAAGVGVALSGEAPQLWLAGLSLAFAALGSRETPVRSDLLALSLTAVVAAVGLSLLDGVPAFRQQLNQLSLLVTGWWGGLRGMPWHLGPSASGLFALGVIAALCAVLALQRRQRGARLAIALALLAVAFVFFQRLLEGIAPGRPASAYSIVSQQWRIALYALPAVWVAGWGAAGTGAAEVSRRRWLLACAALGAAVFLLQWTPRPEAEPRGEILLLDEGFLDWEVPRYGSYGPFNVGLFGQVPDYLDLAGIGWRREKGPVSPELLEGAATLVVINPQKSWPAAELEAIWSFVRAGAGLLVLGDHTDLVGTQASLNQLLEPSGISFRFDSSFPCRESWWHGLEPLAHPAAAHPWNDEHAVISVGATLNLRGPAYPVIVGRYGFSDLGNRLNEQAAYLGDYLYQLGEQLGDVMLVGAARVGKGRVLVLGDTSSLQNAALPYSFEPFVVPMVRWLADPDARHPHGRFVGLVLAAGAGAALFATVGGGAVAYAGLGLALALATGLAGAASRPPPAELAGPIAWVNFDRGERFSQASNQDDGIGAAFTALARSGYTPLVMRRFDAERLQSGELFLTVAPTRGFDEDEIDAVEEFVRAGGLAVVAAGWPERHGSHELLARMGLEVTSVPLGPVPVVRDDPIAAEREPMFVEGWAIRALSGPVGELEEVTFVGSDRDPAAGPPGLPGGGESQGFSRELYRAGNFTLVGSRKVGRGHVLLIGDSLFLGDGNIENMRYHRVGNIHFLRDILAASREGS